MQVGNQLDQGMKAFFSAVVRKYGMEKKVLFVIMEARL